ncbi:conserved hypothetical protein [Ricinus communis]|uniref:Uncharacterized protein n=1 Tax=Ricinus communis TaxID=3988 RepID=B9SMD2_RICCO|nr:conserved hypothetical protein [Ricinus communis]
MTSVKNGWGLGSEIWQLSMMPFLPNKLGESYIIQKLYGWERSKGLLSSSSHRNRKPIWSILGMLLSGGANWSRWSEKVKQDPIQNALRAHVVVAEFIDLQRNVGNLQMNMPQPHTSPTAWSPPPKEWFKFNTYVYFMETNAFAGISVVIVLGQLLMT